MYAALVASPFFLKIPILGGVYLAVAIAFPPIIWSIFFSVVFHCIPLCTSRKLLRKKMIEMEQYLSLCEISNDEFDKLFEETDYGVCDYKVVGSAGDGFGFFPSQGSNTHLGENRSVLTQDIDLNIFMNKLKPTKNNLIAVPGAEGFTWIKITEQEKEELKDPVLLASLTPASDNSGYFLSAARISREATKYFPKDNGQTQVIEHFPALTVVTEALGPNGNQAYEVDYAFALRYQDWPDAAAEWITRRRYGIDERTVELIASRGCYLVHKQCGHDNVQHEHDFDWRYTFASAEADLFHYHRDKLALKLSFVILKFLIKMSMKRPGMLEGLIASPWICYLINIAKNTTDNELPALRTYHLKTVFLWMAEEETDLDYYTIKENETLDKVFMKMVESYLTYISSGFLPNYFMRHRNMLAGSRYKAKDLVDAEKLLKQIYRRPVAFIKTKFETQFFNKKTVVTILLICIGAFAALQTARSFINDSDTSSSTSVNLAPNSDDSYDFSSKYFTTKYLDFLHSLCASVVGCNETLFY
ncbi:uncharacterized protein [Watersipora subatra]